MHSNKNRFIRSTLQRIFGALLFAVISTSGQAADTLRIVGAPYFELYRVQPLCQYLEKQLGRPVTYRAIASTGEINNELRSRRADVALMNSFQYVFALTNRVTDIEPLAVLGNADGSVKTYRSCLIVPQTSRLRTIDDVVRQAGSIRLAFAYASSTSGHIVPRLYFNEQGINYPEAIFNEIYYPGSQLATIQDVERGRADAGFCSDDDWINYARQGTIQAKSVRVIWYSRPIPQSPIIMQKSLPNALKAQLSQLFLKLHQANPALWRQIQRDWGAVQPARFVVPPDQIYTSIREQSQDVGNLVFFLNYYEEKIIQQNQRLAEGDQELKKQQARIQQQAAILEKQLIDIDNQRSISLLLGVVALLLGSAGWWIYRKNRAISRLNNQLNENNQTLALAINELHTAQDQLVHAEKMASLGILTAGIAHEINNPVNFILTGINSLERNLNALLAVTASTEQLARPRFSPAETEQLSELKQQNRYDQTLATLPQFIDGIRLGARRTADIVRSLRNFSRTDDNQPQPTDLHDCLASALVLLQYQFTDKIRLEKRYAATLPTITGYPGPLSQAFMNLIMNGIQSMQAATEQQPGVLTIQTEQRTDALLVTISDTGNGIEPGNLKRIFDPFYTTKPVGEGTGLGLSITYGIIEKHGGQITVDSQIGVGTTVCISLPRSVAD